jgi:hypothetical protein
MGSIFLSFILRAVMVTGLEVKYVSHRHWDRSITVKLVLNDITIICLINGVPYRFSYRIPLLDLLPYSLS